MNYSIKTHLSFSAWACRTLTDKLRQVDESILYSETNSSFASIAKTLLHVWDAEVIWLSRLNGISPTDWPSKNFNGTASDLFNGLEQSSKDLLQFIETKDDQFLQQSIQYKNLKGDTFEESASGILFHVVNHGTYHRGQIITLLRGYGITELPATDLIVYLRTTKK